MSIERYLRVIFMGTPAFAIPTLETLHKHPGVKVVLVVTRPDAPKGRGLETTKSEVKCYAEKEALEIFSEPDVNSPAAIEKFGNYMPDIIWTCAFGVILKKELLALPDLGCHNVHASLLPKYRGAAPIQRAIMNGETETGITVFRMAATVDAGTILTQEKLSIKDNETSGELYDRLAKLGGSVTKKAVEMILTGRANYAPQNPMRVSYAPKLTKEEGNIDWTKPAREIYNLARGLTPWPGAYSYLGGELIKILEVSLAEAPGGAVPGEIVSAAGEEICVMCGGGRIVIKKLQAAGGRAMTVKEFLAGHSIQTGQKFTPQ